MVYSVIFINPQNEIIYNSLPFLSAKSKLQDSFPSNETRIRKFVKKY
jgi:hypothetical protein